MATFSTSAKRCLPAANRRARLPLHCTALRPHAGPTCRTRAAAPRCLLCHPPCQAQRWSPTGRAMLFILDGSPDGRGPPAGGPRPASHDPSRDRRWKRDPVVQPPRDDCRNRDPSATPQDRRHPTHGLVGRCPATAMGVHTPPAMPPRSTAHRLASAVHAHPYACIPCTPCSQLPRRTTRCCTARYLLARRRCYRHRL